MHEDVSERGTDPYNQSSRPVDLRIRISFRPPPPTLHGCRLPARRFFGLQILNAAPPEATDDRCAVRRTPAATPRRTTKPEMHNRAAHGAHRHRHLPPNGPARLPR